ncbi:MAG TPA: twin-arginine translocase subunit TatC [Vicinamibacterales bacterium]|nr:twin-arginine translocase subunit TatC [Vicinamibacterales bacterium]
MALVPFPNKAAKPAANDDEPDWDDHEPEEDSAGKMSFLDHLDELRRRIIISVIAVGVAFIFTFVYVNEILLFILLPMEAIAGQTLSYIDPTEGFFLKIKIALMAGLIVAAPIVFTQVWLFIAPGLYAHEKKLAIPFVLMSTFFFVGGAVFSHYVVFPIVWKFLAEQGLTLVDPVTKVSRQVLTFEPRVEPAFSLYLRLVLALGITFELPTVVLFLAKMGLVTPRFLIRNIKYAVMIIMVAAAVLSPDGGGVGMLAMGAPVVGLYIFSIGLAWMFGKKRKKLDEETA